MTTLQQITESIGYVQKRVVPKKGDFAIRYLGKFKGIVPKKITSSEYISKLRETLYGKIK